MIQEKARKMIEEAVVERVSDIYLIPRGENYQVYHRIMDEREYIQELDEDEVMAIISHFKFLAGLMSVKNGVASKALVTTIMFQGRFPFGYQRLVIIVVKKVWSFVCSMIKINNLNFGLEHWRGLLKKSRDEGSIFFQGRSVLARLHSCTSWRD